MKNAFAYGRFSTDEQGDGTSIENQLLACKKYAESNNLRIIKEYSDNGVSGTIDMEYRPSSKVMLESLYSGEAEALIMYVPDRANRDYANAAVLRKKLKRKGIDVHFTNIGLISGINEIFVGFLDMLAQKELEDIRDRTIKGKINQIVLKQKPVWSSYPFGYKKIGVKKDSYLVIDEEKAKVIVFIFNKYVYDSWTLQKIATELNAKRIPTSKGNQWFQRTVHIILKNSLYKGLYCYGKTALKEKEYDNQSEYDRVYKVTEDNWKTLYLPELQIISDELWEEAQNKLNKNLEMSRWIARNKGRYLLTGFLYCPHCNYKMGGAVRKRKNGNSFVYVDGNHNCPVRTSIVQEKIDNAVWGLLKEQISNEELLDKSINRMIEKRNKAISSNVSQKEELEKNIADFEKQIQRLARSIARLEDDEVIKTLENEITAISKQKKDFEKKLVGLRKLISESYISDGQREEIKRIASEINKRLSKENIPVTAKRKLLGMLNLRVEFHRIPHRYLKIDWELGNNIQINLDDDSHKQAAQHVYTNLHFEAIISLEIQSTVDNKMKVNNVSNIKISDYVFA